jgi:imidazolonepropionase-like amidohydrolase
MTSISVTNKVVTLITVYEVAPADQQQLIDLITMAYEQVIRHLPGFVEAHTHRSSDGVRVVSYAQWDAQADVEAMLRNNDLWPIFVEIGRIASADPRYYQVAADWTPA